jgi:predicted kinase
MDLLAHGRADLAWRFLDVYLAEGGDYAGLAVLRYYLVYRACVRALVSRIRQPQAACGAPDYLALARQLMQAGRARLMITCGVSGSGKSFAAARLLEHCGAIRLRSDVERKRLFGLDALADSARHVPGGIYGAEANRRTYERLAELAATMLQAGWPVIVDAAFLRAREREDFRSLAANLGVPFAILHCAAPEDLLFERVRLRHARATDPSEADVDVLRRQLEYQEALRPEEWPHSIALDTSLPWQAEVLAARWAAAG